MLEDKEKEQWAYEMLHWHGIDIYGSETKDEQQQ